MVISEAERAALASFDHYTLHATTAGGFSVSLWYKTQEPRRRSEQHRRTVATTTSREAAIAVLRLLGVSSFGDCTNAKGPVPRKVTP